MGTDERDVVPAVVLRARPTTAAAWSVVATLVAAAGLFFVIDSGGHVLAWTFLAFACIAVGFFVFQLVPGAVVVRLSHDALESRWLWRRSAVRWEEVRLARVRRVAGDPVLALEVREQSPVGDAVRHRVIGVLLPVGCDLEEVHDFLERRLGRAQRLSPPPGFRAHHL